jgi:hypothetical protein
MGVKRTVASMKRKKCPPLSMHDDVYDLHVVAPPMCGSHTGDYMVDFTSEVLGAGSGLAYKVNRCKI